MNSWICLENTTLHPLGVREGVPKCFWHIVRKLQGKKKRWSFENEFHLAMKVKSITTGSGIYKFTKFTKQFTLNLFPQKVLWQSQKFLMIIIYSLYIYCIIQYEYTQWNVWQSLVSIPQVSNLSSPFFTNFFTYLNPFPGNWMPLDMAYGSRGDMRVFYSETSPAGRGHHSLTHSLSGNAIT